MASRVKRAVQEHRTDQDDQQDGLHEMSGSESDITEPLSGIDEQPRLIVRPYTVEIALKEEEDEPLSLLSGTK